MPSFDKKKSSKKIPVKKSKIADKALSSKSSTKKILAKKSADFVNLGKNLKQVLVKNSKKTPSPKLEKQKNVDKKTKSKVEKNQKLEKIKAATKPAKSAIESPKKQVADVKKSNSAGKTIGKKPTKPIKIKASELKNFSKANKINASEAKKSDKKSKSPLSKIVQKQPTNDKKKDNKKIISSLKSSKKPATKLTANSDSNKTKLS